MAQEMYYTCPKCHQQVHAVAPLTGAVCLQCNGVQHWQPTLIKIGNAMRKESNTQNALSVAMGLLQSEGIYQDFMRLYGTQLMHSLNINIRSQQNDTQQSQDSHKKNNNDSKKNQNHNQRQIDAADDVKKDEVDENVIYFDGKSNKISFNGATYEAYNIADSKSKGPWPNGVFEFDYFKRRVNDETYGNVGNVIFKGVPGRKYMGIHAGRDSPRHPTNGCIRKRDDTMIKLMKFIGINDWKEMKNESTIKQSCVATKLVLKVQNNESNEEEWKRKQKKK